MADKSGLFRGTFPALITPMQEDGNRINHAINYGAMGDLVHFVLDNGCEGVVVAGCTAHSAGFRDAQEQLESIKFVKNAVDSYNKEKNTRKIVIAGDGMPSTYNTLELAKRVEGEAGVFNHLMISPSTNKPSQDGLLKHYSAVADGINGNGRIIMYSVPGRTGGQGILTETAVSLAYHPNIAGIKEASGDEKRIRDTIEGTRGLDFAVLSGDDSLNMQIIGYGGSGTISVAANVDPQRTSASVRLALNGMEDNARRINAELESLYKALFLSPSGSPSMAHYALRQSGFSVGVPRLPLTDAAPENAREMDRVLSNLGLVGLLQH